ncbi:hypothetical protein [Breoghania sp.]|uniref:hypothetical protein n=1 Tax=Breoghania sp. TaxID=2065378 RepID=UPI0029C9BA5A|nr:hypothetical protein [Breoghania sp.]
MSRFPASGDFPGLSKPLRMRLETVDIGEYRDRLMSQYGPDGFKQALIRDLESRRNRYCFGMKPPVLSEYAMSSGFVR